MELFHLSDICSFVSFPTGNDVEWMRKVHAFQKKEYLNMFETLRDDFGSFGENMFSDFMVVFKQYMPPKTIQITCFAQCQALANIMVLKSKSLKALYGEYVTMRERVTDITKTVQRNIVTPLLLVHSNVETEQQRTLKARMRAECAKNLRRLANEFNWSLLEHPEFAQKIVVREHQFFLGMISVLAVNVDMLNDIDQQLDEYLSGVPSHINLTH